ncbi:MAG: alpha/beta hydrolase, partial [Campylobacterales bacterium]|nr:alpha/beta hydrolase [Campylobacterales bacterium]
PHSKEDLEILLRHKWDKMQLKELVKQGVQIEVFLGGKDRIINAYKANEFFSEVGITYLIKDAGHSLVVVQ